MCKLNNIIILLIIFIKVGSIQFQLDNCTSECGGMKDCANPSHHDPWIRSQCNIQCATNLKKVIILL